MSEETTTVRKLEFEYSNGERQEILLDAASVGKALEIGLRTYVAPVALVAPNPTVIGTVYTVLFAGDYTPFGGTAAMSVGDTFLADAAVNLTGALSVGVPADPIPVGLSVKNNITGPVDYSALNPNETAVATDAEVKVTNPDVRFAAGTAASFSVSETKPRVVLV